MCVLATQQFWTTPIRVSIFVWLILEESFTGTGTFIFIVKIICEPKEGERKFCKFNYLNITDFRLFLGQIWWLFRCRNPFTKKPELNEWDPELELKNDRIFPEPTGIFSGEALSSWLFSSLLFCIFQISNSLLFILFICYIARPILLQIITHTYHFILLFPFLSITYYKSKSNHLLITYNHLFTFNRRRFDSYLYFLFD